MNQVLARAQASFFFQFVAEWAFTVAIGLVAYAHGGAIAVGVVGLVRLLPAGLLGPFVAAYGDTIPRERLLMIIAVVRGLATLGIGGVLYAGWGMAPVFVLAAVSQIAFTPFRGTHSALLPLLCRTPEQLMSVNVVRGALDSLSIVLGPLLAAGIVAVTDVAAVFLASGACSLLSAALLLGASYERIQPARHDLLRELGEGLRVIRTHRGVLYAVGMMVFQTAIRGAYSVFVVVVTIDLLRRSDSAVGVLQASMGVGALVGSAMCARLIRVSSMARWLGVGLLLWSLPLALLGAVPLYAVGLLASALIGWGNAAVDITVFTLIQRLAPDHVLSRVFGAMESMIAIAVGTASLLTPLLIDLVGLQGALLVVGLAPSIVVVLVWRSAVRLDGEVVARTHDIELLRAVPILRPLPVPVLERLCREMVRRTTSASETICRAGDPGDSYFVITAGTVEVLDDDELVRTLGPGDGFGEVALLGDGVRTMTVVASGPCELFEIDRAAFMLAVSSFVDVGSAAHATRAAYLSHAPGRLRVM